MTPVQVQPNPLFRITTRLTLKDFVEAAKIDDTNFEPSPISVEATEARDHLRSLLECATTIEERAVVVRGWRVSRHVHVINDLFDQLLVEAINEGA